MAFGGEAGKNLAELNAGVKEGVSGRAVLKLWSRLNGGHLNPKALWDGLSDETRAVLGLTFMNGRIVKTPERTNARVADRIPGRVGVVIRNDAELVLADALTRYRHGVLRDPVRAAQLGEMLTTAPAVEGVGLVARCPAATRATVQVVEHHGDWDSIATAVEPTEVIEMRDLLEGCGFSVETPDPRPSLSLVVDPDDAESRETGIVVATRAYHLAIQDTRLRNGNGSVDVTQAIGVAGIDYFEVALSEVAGYCSRPPQWQSGPLTGEAGVAVREAISAQESSIVTPVASLLVVEQKVTKT